MDIAAPSRRLTDVLVVTHRGRHAVQTAVAADDGAYETVVLRLCGSLDSSIIAAFLAEADRRFVALTLVTRDRGGDGRVHARAVAAHLGVPLVEAMRETSDVDLAASAARGMPRPSARAFESGRASWRERGCKSR